MQNNFSEKIFQFLFDNSSDSIFVTNTNSDILKVNKVACDIMGYTKEELLNTNLKEIKTPKYREIVAENIKNIIKKGKHTFETEHVTKNGIIIPYEMSSRLVKYNDNQVIISVARNITNRKSFEKELLTTIIATEEKERKRFSADLHDGLSPILSTIKLYADLLKKDNFKHTSKEEIISNIEELVESAIVSAKEIARNITPNILHDFGLAIALKDFCKYINNTKSIKIHLKTDEYRIDERSVIETVLYQTAKELINNTLKHSSAKNIVIDLKSTEKQLILYYKDDGVGFDFKKEMNKHDGLGLNNIINKIKSIEGTTDFYSKKDKGMVLLITIRIK